MNLQRMQIFLSFDMERDMEREFVTNKTFVYLRREQEFIEFISAIFRAI